MDFLQPTIERDFVSSEPFELESGEVLPELRQRFCVYGELNQARNNAILVFHALTGNARVGEWWREIIGANRALDTDRFAIVCANYIGSCYGSTSEISTLITTRDVVRAQIRLLDELKIARLKAVVGGSVGGQLALQTAVDFPELTGKVVAVGACELPALGLALNHLQREAIKHTNDVSLARQIAMISYKSAETLDQNHARKPNRNGENPRDNLQSRFDVAGYLDHQGAKFERRFDTHSYNLISKAMDLFEISDDDARKITADITLIGISSDWLYPPQDVAKLAKRLNANYLEMISPDGHDAFLSDTAKMNEILKQILATH